MSALCSETNEFHKRLLLFGVDYSKSARNEEPSSRGTLNSGLASVDSGLQLNLEIALSGVSAKVQSAFQLGRRCVETSGDVIKGFVRDSRDLVKSVLLATKRFRLPSQSGVLCFVSKPGKKILKFFEMSAPKIFRKGKANHEPI